jgi:hypothetical protein
MHEWLTASHEAEHVTSGPRRYDSQIGGQDTHPAKDHGDLLSLWNFGHSPTICNVHKRSKNIHRMFPKFFETLKYDLTDLPIWTFRTSSSQPFPGIFVVLWAFPCPQPFNLSVPYLLATVVSSFCKTHRSWNHWSELKTISFLMVGRFQALICAIYNS